ncbi:FitA-like ribbon-helix-helix domain-containing protein [Microlunatus parietis]|nr:Arc family DNA-binding protein [Microlunatus parietis]
MTAITIRKLPDSAKQRLRMRAAANGRSMEAEARTILLDALESTGRVDLTWIEALKAAGDEFGGVELVVPEDEPATAADLTKP